MTVEADVTRTRASQGVCCRAYRGAYRWRDGTWDSARLYGVDSLVSRQAL